jgi:hypothetical protein
MMVRWVFTALMLLVFSAPSLAEPTAVTVRVIARDAKYIGTSMGGVRVTLRDVATGAMLARGLTEGGTGDTQKIMQAQGRSPDRAGADAAAFNTSLDIAVPTHVELIAEGPLGFPGSVLRVTQQRWIMPGRAVTEGEGWVVEMPGLVISPQTSVADGKIAISAKVELMCGCPITPGGLWDSADYAVEASLWAKNGQVAVAPLAFVTAPGGYEGSVALPGRGSYRLVLFARNIRTGNSGVTEVMVRAD